MSGSALDAMKLQPAPSASLPGGEATKQGSIAGLAGAWSAPASLVATLGDALVPPMPGAAAERCLEKGWAKGAAPYRLANLSLLSEALDTSAWGSRWEDSLSC